MSNRLKVVLPEVISISRSACVSDRVIFDNILVAYKMVHFLRSKRYGKEGFMSLKLDMTKAYDRFE